MAREKELYRVNLERVLEAFKDQPELVSLGLVADWLGIYRETLLEQNIKVVKVGRQHKIAKTEIARFIS